MKEVRPKALMIYVDNFPLIRMLKTNDEKGAVLEGLMNYFETGEIVEITNSVEADTILKVMVTKCDYSIARYRENCIMNKYHASTGKIKKQDRPSFEEWIQQNKDRLMEHYGKEAISEYL